MLSIEKASRPGVPQTGLGMSVMTTLCAPGGGKARESVTPPSTGTVGVTPNEAPFGANAWTFTIRSQPVNVAVSNWSDVTGG